MSTSFQEHSPRICRLWCVNPEIHSSLHFSHGASGCCWETSDVSTCAPRIQASLPLLQLLLRSHSQCSSASLLSAFPEQLLVSRPSGQVSPCVCPTEPSSPLGPLRAFPILQPTSPLLPALTTGLSSGRRDLDSVSQVPLWKWICYKGLATGVYLFELICFFAFQRQSGCNFSSRLSVWLLYPSLLILPFSQLLLRRLSLFGLFLLKHTPKHTYAHLSSRPHISILTRGRIPVRCLSRFHGRKICH